VPHKGQVTLYFSRFGATRRRRQKKSLSSHGLTLIFRKPGTTLNSNKNKKPKTDMAAKRLKKHKNQISGLLNSMCYKEKKIEIPTFYESIKCPPQIARLRSFWVQHCDLNAHIDRKKPSVKLLLIY